ncbi:helix-turn-helix domain-containing protein [Emcibacter nanhaiensis]|nr:helix-turn-helix domain-containing protein [Emcibacter nanhaiensis]
MSETGPRLPKMTLARMTLGTLLRQWRKNSGLSQLDLALDIGVSTRHLSFLECDKALPSEPMLKAISTLLDIPEAEQNMLRLAAGFKPLPYKHGPETEEHGRVRKIIEQVKRAHKDVPLLVKDQIWDIIDLNNPAQRFFKTLTGRSLLLEDHFVNVLELIFAPDLLRKHIVNWEDVADATVRHVHHETGLASENPAFQAVLDRVMDFSGFRERWINPLSMNANQYATRYIFNEGGKRRSYDSVLISLGAPYEAILGGIRFDTFHAVTDE